MDFDIKPNVENYAMHLKSHCTDKELHDLVGSIFPDEDVMEAWNLTEQDYFTAIEVAYFIPDQLTNKVH
jgi:hypothetical protein